MASSISHPEPPDVATTPTTVAGTLGDFRFASGCEDGIAVDALDPGTHLVVRTRRSCYRFDMLEDRRALVVGGMFKEPTEVRIEGATAGGTVIKIGWIGVGLRLELTTRTDLVTTTAVQGISTEEPAVARIA